MSQITRADIINQFKKCGQMPPPDLLPKPSSPSCQVRQNGEVLALSVTLSLKTISEANTTGHLRAKLARKKSQRNTVRHAFAKLAGMLPTLPAVVTLMRIGPRVLDDDNLRSALKAVRDGLADVIGVDDGDGRYNWQYDQQPGQHGYAVRIHIQSVTEDSNAASQKNVKTGKGTSTAGGQKAAGAGKTQHTPKQAPADSECWQGPTYPDRP